MKTRESKIKETPLFYESYVEAYAHKLEVKKNKQIEKFSSSHSKEETSVKVKRLDEENSKKLEAFKVKAKKQENRKVKSLERKEANDSKRIWELDFLRGIIILGMVFDHFMFFLGMFSSLYAEGSLPLWLLNVVIIHMLL